MIRSMLRSRALGSKAPHLSVLLHDNSMSYKWARWGRGGDCALIVAVICFDHANFVLSTDVPSRTFCGG